MKTSWTNGKDTQDKQDIRQSFVAALVMRKRLLEILEEKIRSSWKASISKDGYECANWALKQADARGYERAMREVQQLISEGK